MSRRTSCIPRRFGASWLRAAFASISQQATGPMQDRDQDIHQQKAVAISDVPGGPPELVAKGRGYQAEKILEIAFREGVKVRKDSGLVDILEAFEVESPVPLEALAAVSVILERVYLEEGRLRGEQRILTTEGANRDR